jgi:hypothetical protein
MQSILGFPGGINGRIGVEGVDIEITVQRSDLGRCRDTIDIYLVLNGMI